MNVIIITLGAVVLFFILVPILINIFEKLYEGKWFGNE